LKERKKKRKKEREKEWKRERNKDEKNAPLFQIVQFSES